MIHHLPGNSRVWFFGANRMLEAQEIDHLKSQLDAFTQDWTAHGAELSAGYEIVHDIAVIIAVDETVAAPSGCSIDKAFKLLENTGIDFFQRQLIWQPFCNTAKIFDIPSAKQAFADRLIDENTQVLNSLVTNLSQAREHLYLPLAQSWAYTKISRSL